MTTSTVILLIITAGLIIYIFVLWNLLSIQNNKIQVTISDHENKYEEIKAKTKAQQHELKLLHNAFDAALIITNTTGIIQLANEAAKKLCHGRKINGQSISATFLDHEICEQIINAIKKNEIAQQKIILHNSSFGQQSTKYRNIIEDTAWLIDYAPLPQGFTTGNPNETPLHRIILRNVTSEHRTDQVKREFVANASHELRTPLAIISGYLENLIDDDVVESPASSRKILTTMRKHSERIARIIEEMLIISKLESGTESHLNKEPFILNDTINTVIDRLSPLIQKQNATLSTSYTPENIQLTGDSFYWEQALYNIIENALKQNATVPLHIDINAKIHEENKQFTINISDNGKGIPSAHLPYIFNRFYRVQKHHSQNQVKGTGLGLSIVKHAIEVHGGTISATSTPGIETNFHIICPMDSENLKTETPLNSITLEP